MDVDLLEPLEARDQAQIVPQLKEHSRFNNLSRNQWSEDKETSRQNFEKIMVISGLAIQNTKAGKWEATGNQTIAANPRVTMGGGPSRLVAKLQAIHAACFEKLITAIADRLRLHSPETLPVKAGRWSPDAEG